MHRPGVKNRLNRDILFFYSGKFKQLRLLLPQLQRFTLQLQNQFLMIHFFLRSEEVTQQEHLCTEPENIYLNF